MASLSEGISALAARIAEVVKTKADNSTVVHNTGTETIGGAKTFSTAPQVPVGALLANPVRRDDARLTDARTPLAHEHSPNDIVGAPGEVISTEVLPPALRSTVAVTNTENNWYTIPLDTYWQYLALDITMQFNSGMREPTGTTVNHHNILVTALAVGGTRNFVIENTILLSTGLTERTISVPEGEVLISAYEYSSLRGKWILTALTVSSS